MRVAVLLAALTLRGTPTQGYPWPDWGSAGGVATLDASGKIYVAQIPASVLVPVGAILIVEAATCPTGYASAVGLDDKAILDKHQPISIVFCKKL